MIIDAHNHPDWHGHNLDRFLKNMDDHNIDITWLLSWETPADEHDPAFLPVLPPEAGTDCAISFDRCISYAERAPGRFILGYTPDPRKPDAIDKLDAAIRIYGVRICGELKFRMMYDNPDALRMFRFCGEKGLPVIVHLDYEFETYAKYPRPNYWYGGGIEALERAVKACPDTIFLGHAPGFWAHISGDDKFDKEPYPTGKVEPGGKLIDMLDTYPNLYCDISSGSGCNALSRDPEFGRQFLIDYSDRILYARDYFDNKHQEFINSLDLPKEVTNQIYSGNALKLVPLNNK
ncbi:MAG: amidohydrolase family protein [Armatimonadota bacterium]